MAVQLRGGENFQNHQAMFGHVWAHCKFPFSSYAICFGRNTLLNLLGRVKGRRLLSSLSKSTKQQIDADWWRSFCRLLPVSLESIAFPDFPGVVLFRGV